MLHVFSGKVAKIQYFDHTRVPCLFFFFLMSFLFSEVIDAHHHDTPFNTEMILVASDDTPLTITRACSPSRNRIHIKHIKDTIYNLMIFTRSKISLRFFILAAAAPLLCFFLFSQSFAFLFVASWTPMHSLALLVAILHRVAAHAFSKGMSTGL